jgi:CheY-like chemotaxis protein
VLVAEDEDMVRALLAEILRDAGYEVLQARDGVEAVELFDAHASQISLVVLDAIMPRLDGRGAYERIAARAPQMRFLLSSGYGAEQPSSLAGVHRLDKPYVPSELLRAVRDALA